MLFTSIGDHPMVMERKWEPKIESAPNCPRCASPNTKFCYYNNYSLSQPRYFCKGCKRYWTKGGSLRNVPVGGGCRKSRRSKSARGAHVGQPAPSPATANESKNGSGGAEIDLADVFAKYLSHSGGEESSPSGTCSGSSSLDLPSKSVDTDVRFEEFMIECENPSEYLTDAVVWLDEGLPQVSVGENVEGLLELQYSMLGGDDHQEITGQDALWSSSSDHTISLENFAWQPMVQLEDFGSFSTHDDDNNLMKMSANNLVCDNWSSFDLSSGCEIFSRPWN